MCMRILVSAVAAAGLLSAAPPASAETQKVDFSGDAVGQPPKGFVFAHTANTGSPGKWVVQQDGDNKVLAQTDPDSTRSRFPLAVLSDVSAADVDLSVRIKPVSAGSIRRPASSGATRTRTTTTWFAPTRWKTMSCVYKVENGTAHRSPGQGPGPDVRPEGHGPVRPVEHAARSSPTAPSIRGLLQRGEAVRGRGHDIPPGRPGRRLDQGRFGHAVRRPDGGHEVGRCAERRLTSASRLSSLSWLSRSPRAARPIQRRAAAAHGHHLRLDRSRLLRARAPRIRAPLRREGQRGLRHRGNQIHRPGQPADCREGRGRRPTCSGRTSRSARWC